jgi:hypothetical protein
MSGINIDNFEDGQYDADDSMYTDEDNALLEEAMKKAMHSKKDEDETKTVCFSKSGEIDPELVKQAVYSQINFVLPEHIWDEINAAFGECWNNEIGIRGWVHENQIENYIHEYLRKKKRLFEYDKIEIITKIIHEHLRKIGAFLDE